jgi:MFS family permease
MTPTALSIIATTFPDGAERNRALGIWGALGGVGATAAWLVGGPLVDGPGWAWIFFINLPLGLAALALSPLLLRESRATTTVPLRLFRSRTLVGANLSSVARGQRRRGGWRPSRFPSRTTKEQTV